MGAESTTLWLTLVANVWRQTSVVLPQLWVKNPCPRLFNVRMISTFRVSVFTAQESSRYFGGLRCPQVTAYKISWIKDWTRVVTHCPWFLVSGSPLKGESTQGDLVWRYDRKLSYFQGVGVVSCWMADRIRLDVWCWVLIRVPANVLPCRIRHSFNSTR